MPLGCVTRKKHLFSHGHVSGIFTLEPTELARHLENVQFYETSIGFSQKLATIIIKPLMFGLVPAHQVLKDLSSTVYNLHVVKISARSITLLKV